MQLDNGKGDGSNDYSHDLMVDRKSMLRDSARRRSSQTRVVDDRKIAIFYTNPRVSTEISEPYLARIFHPLVHGGH